MPYEITYQSMPGYLFVRMEGPESLESAVNFWQGLSEKAAREGWEFFLIEDRVAGKLSRIQIFQISEVVARLFSGKVIAYVDPKEDTFLDNVFGETLVQHRGCDAVVFRSEPDAVRWLTQKMNDPRRTGLPPGDPGRS